MLFVDLVAYDLLEQLEVLSPGCLRDTPLLRGLVHRIGNCPQIASYITSNRYINRPFNNLNARFL